MVSVQFQCSSRHYLCTCVLGKRGWGGGGGGRGACVLQCFIHINKKNKKMTHLFESLKVSTIKHYSLKVSTIKYHMTFVQSSN